MSAVQARRPKVETLETRKRIVDLAREGHTIRSIAAVMGFESPNAVSYHLDAYRAELTPSAELAEEWRQTRLARADERFRRLGPKALGRVDPEGNWLEEPDYAALSALQREEESITKMLGANLEQGSFNITVTREALAHALGRVKPLVIEATPSEITDGGES